MEKVNYKKLKQALLDNFSKETYQGKKRWFKNNPAYGHCAVASLIVQDYFGGEIVSVWANMPDGGQIKHFNNLINGITIDTTITQFPRGTKFTIREFVGDVRQKLLKYKDTQEKYLILKEKVNRKIKENL